MFSRWFFAVTVFVAAFLLFQVQPMAGKALLPRFGGAAAVWATCLLFFQCALALGYLYAHLSVSLLPRGWQAALHTALLLASLAFLPLALGSEAGAGGDPSLSVLATLAVGIGLPYLLLASTSPLMQAWYAASGAVPYRLFALSNLASLAGLLAYPLAIEPSAALASQMGAWSWTYAAMVALGVCAAAASLKSGGQEQERAGVAEKEEAGCGRVLWFLLPACATSLLVALTTHLTQNVAPVPLFWIVPLALYLSTFILCFEREGWYSVYWFRLLPAGALYALAYGFLKQSTPVAHWVVLTVNSAAFFVCCMFCHGELARLKPPARSLTSYYLTMSFGGAFGGVFAGLLSSYLFTSYLELPITLAGCALLAMAVFRRDANPAWKFWALLTVILIAIMGAGMAEKSRVRMRNFYGALAVRDSDDGRARILFHGSINHGAQFLEPTRRREATTYFGPRSGIGLALEAQKRPRRRVGVVGLGAGTLAAHAREGDVFRFYEINPQVIEIARTEFSFLRDARGTIEVVEGDGRLALEKEPEQSFDTLILDAFSGDSVPVHLLTREAFAMYFRRLKPDGVLGVHVSNIYLDLAPLAAKAVEEAGRKHFVIHSMPDRESMSFSASWVLATTDEAFLKSPEIARVGQQAEARPGLRPWRDDYSNLLQVLR